MTRPATLIDSFDKLVLTELEIVRTGEERLERLFPKLRLNPQLQDSFLQELAAVRKRADRLDAILSGIEVVERMPVASFNQLPAA
jgi:ABC-type phosphate transport system auxiliary subunit